MSLTQTLHTAHQIMSDAVETYAGLTHTRALLIAALAKDEGVSQTVLTAKTNIDRSTLASTMRNLMREGYVTRTRTRADHRRYAITLTPHGRAVARTIAAAEADIEAYIAERVANAAKLSIRPAATEHGQAAAKPPRPAAARRTASSRRPASGGRRNGASPEAKP